MGYLTAASVSVARLAQRQSYKLRSTPYADQLYYRSRAYLLPLNNHRLLLSIGGRLHQHP